MDVETDPLVNRHKYFQKEKENNHESNLLPQFLQDIHAFFYRGFVANVEYGGNSVQSLPANCRKSEVEENAKNLSNNEVNIKRFLNGLGYQMNMCFEVL
jgi:hypothetical protein